MTTYVALDIESTGLDLNHDAITEIGAVKFNERRIEDEWTTLVNPGRQIPDFITGLTGIDNAMVRQAPQHPRHRPRTGSLRRGCTGDRAQRALRSGIPAKGGHPAL